MSAYIAIAVFCLVWIATFLPCWKLLVWLISRSELGLLLNFRTLLYTVLYLLLIVAPYVSLLFIGRESLPGLITQLLYGIVTVSLVLAVIRIFWHKKVAVFLWWVYGWVYDGLRNFYPYQHLVSRIAEVSDVQGGEKVLDLGCGTGNLSILLDKEQSIVAVDGSKTMLAIARKKLKDHKNTSIIQSDIGHFLETTEERNFDKIIMINVLYALKNRPAVLTNLRKILREGGVLVITNSDKGGSLPMIKEHLSNSSIFKLLHPKLLAVFFIDQLISSMASAGNFSFIDYETVKKEMQEAGFQVEYLERIYGGEQKGVNILLKAY
jgi:ubiquinone/menaquinone biosynthesis C-methylase UbiE